MDTMNVTNIDSIIDTILKGYPIGNTKMMMYPSIVKRRLKTIESLYSTFSSDPDAHGGELKHMMYIVRETCWQIQNDDSNKLELGTAQKVIEGLKNIAAIAIGAQTVDEFKVGKDLIDKMAAELDVI